jgi:hypothetical protein
LAASAAGVGMLAVAQPAEGKIIYSKANKYIGQRSTFHLDLNHDGVADFDLKNDFTTSTAGGAFDQLFAIPDGKENAVWGHTVPTQSYASALSAGVRVGPKGQFLPKTGFMAASSISGAVRHDGNYSCTGPWANVTNRYLGLKFVIRKKEHFGWARLNVSCTNGTALVNATLTGYAYETVANRPILTGKEHGPDEPADSSSSAALPATLGRLARGATRTHRSGE